MRRRPACSFPSTWSFSLSVHFFGKIAKNPQARAALQGVTAGATGAIAGAVYVLGRRAIHDWATVLVAVIALLITLRWKIPEPLLIAGAALAGAMLYR